ncbi:MAG: PAS domain S-box protein [Candidatus Lokiarchaeota archaeon]|nr:PAS domain S-box protein [Candidatus Lokiarchaeota archaeon]
MDNSVLEIKIQYSDLFEYSLDFIFIIDLTGNILDVNNVAVETLGYSKKEILSKNITEIIIEEVVNPIKNTSKELLDIGRISKYNIYVLEKKDGERIYLESHGIPLRENGEINTILGIGHDITEMKKTEQVLKEQREEFYWLNTIITLGNESTSLQEFLIKSFDQVLDIVGFDRGGVYLYNPGTHHHILVHHKNVHPDFIAAVEDVNISEGIFNKIFDKDKPFYIEDFSEFMKGSKELGVYSAVIIPLHSKDQYVGSLNIGSPVHQVLSQNELELLVAIGKQMEIIIQKFESEKLLKESEENYRLISENANDLISVFNDKFNFEYINENLHKNLMGYSNNDLIGKNGIILIHPDDQKIVLQALKKLIATGEGLAVARIRHKNGSYIWTETKGKTFQDTEGKQKILMVTRDITERKLAEQNLKESEEKFRTLTDQSLMGIGILQDEILKYVNNRLANILGFTKEEMKEINFQQFLEMIHPDDRQKVKKQVQRRKDRTRDTITFYQFRAFKKAEELVWVEVYSKIINYEGKRASLLTFLDITDKKIAEIELKESEEKFRAITEQSFMSIMVIQDGVLKYFNERLPKSIGYSSEEIKKWVPNEFAKVIHPDYRDFVLKQAKKKQAGEVDVVNNYIYRSIRKDGTFGWVENFSKSINYGGRSADLVMSIDITDKIEAEQKLKESEEKFRNIAEQSFMGITIIQNGQLKYMNKAMSVISGYSGDEMLNWSEREISEWIYPEDLETVLNRLQTNIEGNMSQFSSKTFRIINRNGKVRWLEDYTTRILYEGKPANLISIVDITDKKEAEELIIEENKRLLELNDLRRDLITRVSHELKTPITSIYGAIQILLKIHIKELSTEMLKYVEMGHRGCLRLKELVDNLLDVSRLDAKKFQLELQKENLVEIIIDCANDMKYLSSNRQLIMDLDLPSESYLNIDKLRFRQVLTNIISNAIKNTPKEGKISINLAKKEDYIDIQIKDTGVGFTVKEKEKLFEKFGKIERYGMDLDVDIEGSGLGLFISKEIIELHGGQIFVESEGRNKGSTFTIRLFKK